MTGGRSDPYYDLLEDFDLITSSLLSQYGIRVYSLDFKEMTWDEFCSLVSGLGPDTPLGRIVAIRAEDDQENIKHFTPDQRRIWRQWRQKQAGRKSEQETMQFLETMQKIFTRMAEEEN